MTPQPVGPAFIKNRAITQMREEIQKGATWLKDFCWALRLCESATDPFVISELPFVIEGNSADLQEVFVLWFCGLGNWRSSLDAFHHLLS
jgi:hypothetical protein